MRPPGTGRMRRCLRAGWATIAAILLISALAGGAAAHEERQVGAHTMLVGLLGEPFLQGPRYGFEFWVGDDGTPLAGLEGTLTATVTWGSETRTLAIAARGVGHYDAEFSPPVDARYVLRLGGAIAATPVDESFTFHLAPPGAAPADGGATPGAPAGGSGDGGLLLILPLAGGVAIVVLAGILVVLGRGGGRSTKARRGPPH